MHAVVEGVRPESRELPRLLPGWGAVLWVAAVVGLWWLAMDTAMGEVYRRHELDVPAAAVRVGVVAGVAGKLLGNLAETAFYASWWALKGPRLPFAIVWSWLISLSLLDTFGVVAAGFASDLDGIVRGVVGAVCNGRLLLPAEVSESHALAFAMSGICLLAVARVIATAWVLARAAGRPFLGSLALTGGAWLATRGLLVLVALLLRGPGAAMWGAAS